MATKSKFAQESPICDGCCFGPSIDIDLRSSNWSDTLYSSVTKVSHPISLPEYEYIPLQPAEIRLLCLTPGPPTSPLEGRLVTATIGLVNGKLRAIVRFQDSGRQSSNLLEFCALSYTWGESEQLASIIIGQTKIRMTANLEDALRELRHEDEAIYVWADALCINQNDFDERANQVSIMLEIYRMATKVYVWLGRSDLTSLVCVERLQRLDDINVRSNDNDEFNGSALPKPEIPERLRDKSGLRVKTFHGDMRGLGEQDVEWIRSECSPWEVQRPAKSTNTLSFISTRCKHVVHSESCKVTQDMIYYALQQFYSRPWLRRIWVRQEVFGGRGIVVICGCERISWDVFLRGIVLLDLLEQNAVQITTAAMRARTLLQSLQDLTKDEPNLRTGVRPSKELVETLVSSRDLEAGKEHDRVFAALGMCGVPTDEARLATDPSRSYKGIHIDYHQTFEQVLQETTLHLLSQATPEDGSYVFSGSQKPRRSYWDALAEVFHYHSRHQVEQGETQPLVDSKRSLSSSSIPSWVVDWRACCSPTERRMIRSRCAPDWGCGSVTFPDKFFSNVQLSMPEFVHKALPVPVLRIRGLVVDVVESLTDRTWDLISFLAPTGSGFHGPTFKTFKYDASIHCRRAAILGGLHVKPRFRQGEDRLTHLAVLVPSATKPGDLIVVVGPRVLPLVLSPAGSQVTRHGSNTVGLPGKLTFLTKTVDQQQEYSYGMVQSLLTEDRRYVLRGPAFVDRIWNEHNRYSRYIREPRSKDMFDLFLI